MNKKKVILPITLAGCSSIIEYPSSARSVPEDAQVRNMSIAFNGEILRGSYLLIDSRSPAEKAGDAQRGHPSGLVIVFLHGHAQRPDDAFEFTSRLALLSSSGIVVIPVCDTPYGSDPSYHGDRGKDVILMEMVRHILAGEDMEVMGFEPINGMKVLVDGVNTNTCKYAMGVRIAAVGWSHGGILARRFAHAHKASVQSLGHVCPAGYEHWDAWGITARFAGESMRMALRMVNGHSAQTLKSAWGFIRGLAGDFFRSIPAAVLSLQPAKLLRIFQDISDCSIYCDSTKFAAYHLEHISVLFGRDDSCMSPARQLEIKDPDNITKEDFQLFHTRFFSDVKTTESLKLRIMPGTHLAPVIYNELYSKTVLADLKELKVI